MEDALGLCYSSPWLLLWIISLPPFIWTRAWTPQGLSLCGQNWLCCQRGLPTDKSGHVVPSESLLGVTPLAACCWARRTFMGIISWDSAIGNIDLVFTLSFWWRFLHSDGIGQRWKINSSLAISVLQMCLVWNLKHLKIFWRRNIGILEAARFVAF